MLMPGEKEKVHTVVKFVSAAHPYNAGDVAGFVPDDPYLKIILRKKWARLWDHKKGEFVETKSTIPDPKVEKKEKPKEVPKEVPKGDDEKEAKVEGKDASAEKDKMIDTAKGGAGVRKKSKSGKKSRAPKK